MVSHLFRKGILAVAGRKAVERFIRGRPATYSLARRFVAGDTLAEALAVSQRLAACGMTSTLDLLGENVRTPEAARAAVESYAETLRGMRWEGLEPNISVKLTMLGLDLGVDLAYDNMTTLLEVAAGVQGFVRIDMEGSAYTERTLAIAETLHDTFPDSVGTVIQAYLHRSGSDIERLIERQMRVRLVKGAYAEPADIALQRRGEIDEAFARYMRQLLEHGRYPAIATHDPELIRATREFAAQKAICPERWEFQMLYGVRRDAQRQLAADGYGMRIYVPYGRDWYPYFTRRIAERPANALFVLRQLGSR
jgi:proline dehydrogenase